ncbi:MAG: hypothetical protein PSV13_12240 [Lacunisphaera sp.]|nr:hypothetical protein [Lacunisphaera sp.]
MEFLLVGAADGMAHLADPLGDFRERVSSLWHLPLDQKVRVDLRDCEFPWLQGRLELAQAPDLPLDPRQSLGLRIGTIEFSSRQIIAWALS